MFARHTGNPPQHGRQWLIASLWFAFDFDLSESLTKLSRSIYFSLIYIFSFVRYKTFEEEINRKSDTLYVVSFRGVSTLCQFYIKLFLLFLSREPVANICLCFQDHLVFPATEYNATQRPKMSFMIMAPPNSKLKSSDICVLMQSKLLKQSGAVSVINWFANTSPLTEDNCRDPIHTNTKGPFRLGAGVQFLGTGTEYNFYWCPSAATTSK